MREGLAGGRIGVGPDIRFRQDVADIVVGKVLGDIHPDRRRGQVVIGDATITVGCGSMIGKNFRAISGYAKRVVREIAA